MGVEYKLYLVPDDPTFKPGPESLNRLLAALYADHYVNATRVDKLDLSTFEFLSPEYYESRRAGCIARLGPEDHRYAKFPCPCSSRDIEALGEDDFQLIWEVDDLAASGLRYPLEKIPDEETYYQIELHVATDYVYHCSEFIDIFDRPVTCGCGQPLEYTREKPWGPLSPSRIYRTCPWCGAPSRPQDYSIRLRSGRTGEFLGLRPGGAVYQFAIVIDCGKCYDRGEPAQASDRFLDLCQKAIGTRFVQIGDFG